ncbi:MULTISPECIES: L-threonine 3-dehydrogenase [Legionella]|uniref:L-threonine 3-dehydrogenase n=1 Tax=Legionella septentrionalis TaxID=2498109 RepID=A0A3S1CMP6_9GAMM|nr:MULTISPECIES: L-threonine 3-dehydrogenase [Legionella]MCP0913045.1 L-threonine 3-dehydrogenase [Legionella sp. 27cVA30]RUQ91500.1 L-threonine 3-dehydrogenase [Legionella septentrionalis]RUQ98496.1 L-threonine 3-dehydrogenase [Legionella septentrionalis]RUR10880.1 L-threonine 3-dehydrogenase [Legionella septentrionalis]RUR14586.1 L-threonine 3-dehydrogenase [Legionella septentrionalis]
MKSLVKAKREPGIWMQEVAVPEYGVNDVLIKIKKTAICGTDIHIYSWDDWAKATIPVPMSVGHEFCGEIVAVGREVQGLVPGQRVSGEGHITCGLCRNCRAGKRHLCRNTIGVGVNRPGSFAEYLALPASNVLPLPDNITDEQAAVLDPLGNATHCALAFDVVGEDVLITGAGPIGIMAAAIVRHIGARHVVITDINDYRLGLAREMGVTRAVNIKYQNLNEVMAELGMTEGFDVGLEMSGNPMALNDMVRTMNHGGRIALLGIPPQETPVNWNEVIFKGLVIKGIYGREMYETWYKMIAMLQSGLDISPVITHHFPVSDYQNAFQIMASGQSGKVILDWS